MLSFQKLRVHQRSIEFLALVLETIGQLLTGHAELADQLLRAPNRNPATSPRVDVNVQVLVHVQVVVNLNVNVLI